MVGGAWAGPKRCRNGRWSDVLVQAWGKRMDGTKTSARETFIQSVLNVADVLKPNQCRNTHQSFWQSGMRNMFTVKSLPHPRPKKSYASWPENPFPVVLSMIWYRRQTIVIFRYSRKMAWQDTTARLLFNGTHRLQLGEILSLLVAIYCTSY